MEYKMRDYFIHEFQQRQAYGRVTWLVRMWKDWRGHAIVKLDAGKERASWQIGIKGFHLRVSAHW
jgi:hypothetical protein